MTACMSASNGPVCFFFVMVSEMRMCNSTALGMHNSTAVDRKSDAALCTSSRGQAKPFMRMLSCRYMSVVSHL